MKISVKLLLITFSIVVLISVSSTLIFYSLTNKILKDQQTHTILNSSNDFIFSLQSSIAGIEDDFKRIVPNTRSIKSINLDTTQIDFLFTLRDDSVIVSDLFKVKSSIILNTGSMNIRNFVTDNSNIILKFQQFKNSQTVYYGKVISSEFLEEMSQKVRAEIALIVNETPIEISNPEKNERYLLSIINSIKELKYKNLFDLYMEELESVDFIASYYSPKTYLTTDVKYGFIIFTASSEASESGYTMRIVTSVIILSGIALSLIFILLFTTKLRRQISYLSQAADIAGKGNFDYRVEIVTKDEIGLLAKAFNSMLDELKNKNDAGKEYSEFITLLNQNPTIHEVSDAVLKKIIKATELTTGALYLVEGDEFRLLSAYGITIEHAKLSQEVDYYESAIKEKRYLERTFTKNHPVIKTGIVEIKVEYLVVVPIIYNREVIAILELASDVKPQKNIKTYIESIQEQLAIGLNNARSFEKLENYISELKELNEVYQKQNKQILDKNEQLIELHKKLEEKAAELEVQKEKAIELTKLKSQFLASISHELRTPLNSIIGLTELVARDQQVLPNNKNRLDIVLRNGKKLLNLINNILEFLKIESGRIDIKSERFLIRDFLKEIREFVEPLFIEKNLKFTIEFAEEYDYLLETDKNKVEQILINLIGNAVKFTERGSVKIKVNVQGDSDLNIQVIDTGIGISEDFKKVIFEEFRQEDSGTTRKYSGTGLGLAIVQKYVQLMNGTIFMDSEIDKGSEFNVFLPGVVLEKISMPSEILFVDKEHKPSVDDRTVLIIAENKETQKIVSDYLVLNKFYVHVAHSYYEGIQYAMQNKPYAVILSTGIVEKNCWMILQQLKQTRTTKDIPVILISIIRDKKLGYGLSVFDYLFSPTSKDDFNYIMKVISNFSHQEIKNIAIIDSPDKKEDKIGNITSDGDYSKIYIRDAKDVKSEISKICPEVILINLLADGIDAIDVIHQLKHTGGIKKIPIIAYTNRDIEDEEAVNLIENMKSVTIKAKHHPMDVLKILRDRLSIEYSEYTKDNLLLEDPKDIAVVGKGDQLTDKNYKVEKRILIVDDDSDTLFTIGEIIKDLGYDTIYARNGVECLLTLNNIEPDIVLLDIMMPQMDGFETIKRIRSDSRFTDLPVIALTAYAMLDNKEVIEKNGFTDIITKPINTNTLAFKIQKTFKKK